MGKISLDTVVMSAMPAGWSAGLPNLNVAISVDTCLVSVKLCMMVVLRTLPASTAFGGRDFVSKSQQCQTIEAESCVKNSQNFLISIKFSLALYDC